MVTLIDRSQFQALAIQNGKHKLPSEHQEIMDFISKQFDVRALDFFCETREASKGPRQQLVHVIMETAEDVKKMQARRADHAVVEDQFLKYFKSSPNNAISDPVKSNVFAFVSDPFPQIIVTYRPLKIDGEIRQELLKEEEQAVLKTFESAWAISMRVVFYYTDAQVKENLANGTSKKLNEALLQVAKKYGFDPGPDHTFDSKETFDRDYESNWYYYWK